MECVANIIYSAAKAYSNLTALKVKDRMISYSRLNRSALLIASFLSEKKISGENIGILGRRNYSAYVGILGTVYSGCAYVPINPKYPPAKIKDIIRDANIRILISSEHDWEALRDVLKHFDELEFLLIPEGHVEQEGNINVVLNAELTTVAAMDKPIASNPNSDVYIMFTSGSTGKPKGVEVSNTNLASFLSNMNRLYDLEPGFRASQTFDLSFDPSVSDIFFTWMKGGTLCVLPEEELYCPSEYIKREKINYWNSVPTIAGFMKKLGALKPNEFPDLKYSTFCGEPLSKSIANSWRQAAPNSTVENIYGPTEATIYITRNIYYPEDSAKEYYNDIVPIGLVFHGHEVALVTDENEIAPNNEVGQLAIKGPQVTKGYLNDVEKTNMAYVNMPWDDLGHVWYKTGDLAFYNDDGLLECIGRKDRQIKIAGRRIEIGEIEYCLRTYGGLENVVVVPHRDGNGVIEGVVAYVTARQSAQQVEKISRKCQEYLESIFFPKEFIYMENIPMTVSGKIDRVLLESAFT